MKSDEGATKTGQPHGAAAAKELKSKFFIFLSSSQTLCSLSGVNFREGLSTFDGDFVGQQWISVSEAENGVPARSQAKEECVSSGFWSVSNKRRNFGTVFRFSLVPRWLVMRLNAQRMMMVR
ncbi:hypothetical protein RYX36_008189 [Vicia faba]